MDAWLRRAGATVVVLGVLVIVGLVVVWTLATMRAGVERGAEIPPVEHAPVTQGEPGG